jgi:hypothetical protein
MTAIRMLATLAVAATLLTAPATFADDAFTAVHMQNQQIGSAVYEYWHDVAMAAAPSLNGFMAIHADNQKIGSAVTTYWQSLSTPADEAVAATAAE